MEGRFELINPKHDNILVERAKAKETVTPGGIVKPASAEPADDIAEVLAVGPGRTLSNGDTVAPDVKVGDTIVLARFSGADVKVNGVDYTIVPWCDVLGVVDESEA